MCEHSKLQQISWNLYNCGDMSLVYTGGYVAHPVLQNYKRFSELQERSGSWESVSPDVIYFVCGLKVENSTLNNVEYILDVLC